MNNSIFSTCKEYMIKKKLPQIQKHFYKLQILFTYNLDTFQKSYFELYIQSLIKAGP